MITPILVLFYSFAAMLLAAALTVIASRDTVRSALALVLTFFSATGLWLLAETEFLALVLILVYVGAVMTLFLFVVMTLNIDLENRQSGFVRYLPWGILVLSLTTGLILYVLLPNQAPNWQLIQQPFPADYSNVKALGEVLYTQYAYPFIIAGALLLVAIVAAISLSLREIRDKKFQSIRQQLSANPKDRVRLVSLKAEKPS